MSTTGRIQKVFKQRRPDQKVMSLFITAGFPDPSETVALMRELAASGADMIELGMPFSDPLADGPTIQYASKVALDKGVHLDMILEMVREFRSTSEIPVILMGYINPILKYGMEPFFHKASESGVDGIIIPDVPPGEFSEFTHLCETCSIDPIYLVAPNTSNERMATIDRASRGFVYCVSVTGVTGARDGEDINRSVRNFIGRVKKNVTNNPVLIGFGIRSHEDAMAISGEVEGFIVGSALIDVIRKYYPGKDWMQRVGDYVRSLGGG